MLLVNAPLPCENPPLTAANMALELQELLAPICTDWKSRGRTIGFGVGIAMGPATVGRIGFDKRMDYAAIGTVTNLAARMCGVAEDGEILVEKSMASKLPPDLRVTSRGANVLKGFPHPVEIYQLEKRRAALQVDAQSVATSQT